MGLFRPSVEFAVRVVGELARAEDECVLRTEDEFLQTHEVNTIFFVTHVLIFGINRFKPKKHG